MTILEKAKLIAKTMDRKKATDIVCIDVSNLTPLSDYFVICSAGNLPQVKAISDEIEDELSKNGFEPKKVKSHQLGEWVLLDYEDIIVHIFLNSAREFYNLEEHWNEAVSIDLSDVVSEEE